MEEEQNVNLTITKFKVERSRWLRGEGYHESYLLRPADNKMCCLGFLGKACGVSEERMRGVQTPTDVSNGNDYPSALSNMLPDLVAPGSIKVAEFVLMDINDTPQITDEQREILLSKIFNLIGLTVEFVD